jgi:hypothetical protein
MKVIRSPGTDAIIFAWSNADRMTDVPPTRAATSSCELQPVTWNSGTEINVRRPAPISAGRPRQVSMFSALVRNASWVVGTPLGLPVVPDV